MIVLWVAHLVYGAKQAIFGRPLRWVLRAIRLLVLFGLAVLVQFNWPTIVLGASSLLLVAAYPFFKRFTYWPQVMLGLTFKWGALVGWSAVAGKIGLPALLLYAGSVLWTIGYDTIYAHQDKEDDLMAGLKSTALRFGERTKPWVSGFYGAAMAFWIAAALLSGAGAVVLLVLGLAGALLAWQVATLDIDDSANCLRRFKSNREIGWLFFGGIVAQMALVALQ